MRRQHPWVALGAVVAVSVAACNVDDGRPVYPSFHESILQLAEARPELSTFVELVKVAGLDAALGGTQASFTVFAPTDAAFAGLPAGALDALRADPMAASALIRFHMVAGKRKANLVQLYDEIETITSTTVHVRTEDQTILLVDHLGGKARLVTSDLEASNGVLDIIDAVLSPPAPPAPPSVVDELKSAGAFTTLLAGISRAHLAPTLSGAGPFTVFAPTDEAFALAQDLSDVRKEVLANILLNHVVTGTVGSEHLDARPLTTLANLPLVVEKSDDVFSIGGQALGEPVDLGAGNGVIHALGGVLLPPTVLEYVATRPELSKLGLAATRAEAELAGALAPDTLDGERPITVFAPSDDAFRAAGLDPATASTATLADVLRRHIVVGQHVLSELQDGQTLVTLSGSVLVHVESSGKVSLLDAEGNRAEIADLHDVRTFTGVVHVVRGILGGAPQP